MTVPTPTRDRYAPASGRDPADDTRFVLLTALEAAVPLHIIELRDRTPEQRVAIGQKSAGEVAHRGDVLEFGGHKRGVVADVFNHLARGLACGAYQPGGITFAGRHWCTDHAVCEGTEPARPAAPEDPDVDFGDETPRRPIVDLELPA